MTEAANPPGRFSKARPFVWFLLANIVCGLVVFRGGLWGSALLAPLDILPAVCPKYHFMDTNSSEIPANHFIVDQVTYDLPVQASIYRSYRNGEIPWWDPYNWAGRPLLAEAHINGTEPIRVLAYLTLPFETAYNWTRILNFLFCGLSMLLLLRHWRFPDAVCVTLALAYEFAGGFVIYFGHPWIQASFNYYPLLWLAWDAWSQSRRWWSLPLATVAVAGAFNAGNLQSHAYVVLFAVAILLGYGGLSWSRWKAMLPMVAVSGGLGAALAMPVILSELEFYKRNLRPVEIHQAFTTFGGLFTLSAIYPWGVGTFRTLDVAKLFNRSNMGFCVYIGSVGILLASLGGLKRTARPELTPVKRAGLWLVVGYFAIVCSPLESVLYTRSAGLALLGLIALAAVGVDLLLASSVSLRRWGRCAAVMTIVIVLAANIASLAIYPRCLDKVRKMVAVRTARTMTGFVHANKLREFQIQNFGNEVSFKNPETIVAFLGMLGFAGVCLWPAVRQRKGVMPALLVLNLVPMIMFAYRYVPAQPIALWQRLIAPDTEQQRVAAILGPDKLRLAEYPKSHFDCLYPNALAHLFQVRTTHGYSSLWPRSFAAMSAESLQHWMPQSADYFYISPTDGEADGYLKKNATPGLARFQWLGPEYRRVVVEKESMNEIELRIEEGTEAQMVRTDTYFPGWTAWIGSTRLNIDPIGPSFSLIKVPAGPQKLTLRYQPGHLRQGIALAGVGLVLLVVTTFGVARFYRKRPTVPSAAV